MLPYQSRSLQMNIVSAIHIRVREIVAIVRLCPELTGFLAKLSRVLGTQNLVALSCDDQEFWRHGLG